VSTLLNLAAYQAVWFAAVIGASFGRPWPGPLAALAFAVGQLATSRSRVGDLRAVAGALALGLALDGLLAQRHWVRYAAPAPAWPPGGAPVWILALWVAFALTLHHSLRWVCVRPVFAAVLGAIGGPLAYLAAARLHAVSMGESLWAALFALGLGWGLALFVLARLARHDQSSDSRGASA
jgi:hypothetical protein